MSEQVLSLALKRRTRRIGPTPAIGTLCKLLFSACIPAFAYKRCEAGFGDRRGPRRIPHCV